MDVGPARHGWQALKAAAVGEISVKSWLGSCAGTESWSAPLECSPGVLPFQGRKREPAATHEIASKQENE